MNPTYILNLFSKIYRSHKKLHDIYANQVASFSSKTSANHMSFVVVWRDVEMNHFA